MEQKAGDHMKRSESELALQEVIKKTSIDADDTHKQIKDGKISVSRDNNNTLCAEIDSFFGDVCFGEGDLSFAFKTRVIIN